MDVNFLKSVTELGSFALVAWILWYVFNKTLPSQSTQFLQALSDQRADFKTQREEDRKEFIAAIMHQTDRHQADAVERRKDFLQAITTQGCELEKAVTAIRDEVRSHSQAQNRQISAHTRAVERLSVGLLYHDATVRGENPETLGTTHDLLKIMISMDSEDLWRVKGQDQPKS